jgi:hypothetical protein
MRSSHNTSTQSPRLIAALQDAGIDPEMFARYLSLTIIHNQKIKHKNAKQEFEYTLCEKQAKLLILLIGS